VAAKVDKRWLKEFTERVLALQEVGDEVEMGLVIASDGKIRKLNKQWLNHEGSTDVISFSAREEPDAAPGFVQPPDNIYHLGEVVVSYPQAAAQAAEYGHSVERELEILIIHGVLHLLGYEHNTPSLEREMRAREAETLALVTGGG